MSAGGTPPPTAARRPSANDRLKARWESHLAVATLLAVTTHAALFLLSPGWVSKRETARERGFEGTSLIALPPLDGLTGATGAPAAPLPMIDEAVDAGGDRGLDDGAFLADASLDETDLWDAIGERLRRRGGLVPAIAEPEDEEVDDPESTSADGPGGPGAEEELDIGGRAKAIDIADLPEPGALDLDRLSSLRPELALQMASSWVLIRNPVEVEAFLRRGYTVGPLDPSVRGSVSVTLWIDQRGAVQWAEISESSGHRDLDEYALAVFNEVAAFRAAREGGVSVSRSVTLSVNFPW